MTVQGITKSQTRLSPQCFKNNKSSISVGDSRPPHCHKATDQHALQVKPQPPSVPAASRGDPVSGPANDQDPGNITVCKLCTGNTMGLGWGTKRVKLTPVGPWERRRRQEKGTTEDEIVGRHRRLNVHEFEQAPGRWRRPGKPGVLQSMGSQRVGQD